MTLIDLIESKCLPNHDQVLLGTVFALKLNENRRRRMESLLSASIYLETHEFLFHGGP